MAKSKWTKADWENLKNRKLVTAKMLREADFQADSDLGYIPPEKQEQSVTHYQSTLFTKIALQRYKRSIEAIKLVELRPHQEEFCACGMPERIGIGSNRAMKTFTAAFEFARAVTGQDPHGKYPKKNGRAFIVGEDWRHIGTTIYPKLFKAGEFKIIKDQKTGKWRAFRPWEDKTSRVRKTKPGPPFIPWRFVKTVAWENKAKGMPSLITLHNGWEIYFCPSTGEPPQGVAADLYWFDEEVRLEKWYNESAARLVDREGLFMWTATPTTSTDQLYNLHIRAQEEQELPEEDKAVKEFFFHIDENPFISKKQRNLLERKLQSEEDRRVRIGGEFLTGGFRIFPEYSEVTHGYKPFAIPHDWCRFMIVDPGRQVCAVLFAAVPPPKKPRGSNLPDEVFGDFCYFYDECYVKQSSAAKFGEAVAPKAKDIPFQAFIIDHQHSRKDETATGMNIEELYSEALRKHNVKSVQTHYGFLWGSTDVSGGIESARGWLNIRADGTSRLRVFSEKCPNFEWEAKRYRYKREASTGRITDTPIKRNDHLMDAFRYLAAYDPSYVAPPKPQSRNYAVRAMKLKMEKAKHRRQMSGGNHVTLGPMSIR